MIEYRCYPGLRNCLAVTAFSKTKPANIVSQSHKAMR
jgi:hypothetical protein